VASWVRSSARLVRDVHPAPRIAGIQSRHTAFSGAFRHLTALLLSEKDGSMMHTGLEFHAERCLSLPVTDL
jgi:hypothetical protein